MQAIDEMDARRPPTAHVPGQKSDSARSTPYLRCARAPPSRSCSQHQSVMDDEDDPPFRARGQMSIAWWTHAPENIMRVERRVECSVVCCERVACRDSCQKRPVELEPMFATSTGFSSTRLTIQPTWSFAPGERASFM